MTLCKTVPELSKYVSKEEGVVATPAQMYRCLEMLLTSVL
jgi:hypothetical protein